MKTVPVKQIGNYLAEANPFKTVASISKLVNEHLFETSNKDVVIFNKPPGFVYLGSRIIVPIKTNFLT